MDPALFSGRRRVLAIVGHDFVKSFNFDHDN
jgi:hypothetical protein